MSTFAEDFIQAESAFRWKEEELWDKVAEIIEVRAVDVPWEDLNVDPCDWDGVAFETIGSKEGFEFTDEQCARIWDLGFNVVNVIYPGEPTRYWRKLKDPMQCTHRAKGGS